MLKRRPGRAALTIVPVAVRCGTVDLAKALILVDPIHDRREARWLLLAVSSNTGSDWIDDGARTANASRRLKTSFDVGMLAQVRGMGLRPDRDG